MNNSIFNLMICFTLVIVTNAEANQTNDDRLSSGEKYFETLCLTCHDASTTENDRVAPPMVAITEHYIGNETSLDDFIQQVTEYVNHPTKENSQMPGAVRRFGLMPKMGYSTAQIYAVASYLYHNHTTLEHPEGFTVQRKPQNSNGKGKEKRQNQSTQLNQQSYLEIGQQLAMSAKAVLGKNLMTALNKQGTEGALSFCHVNATELTESTAIQNQVKIKRVSDRNRTPNNQANEQELDYIKSIQNKLKQQLPISGQTIQQADSVLGYYPIISNAMCLQCHGVPNQDITSTTMEKIQSLYPDDQAINYAVDELRGIWVIEMPQKQTPESP